MRVTLNQLQFYSITKIMKKIKSIFILHCIEYKVNSNIDFIILDNRLQTQTNGRILR